VGGEGRDNRVMGHIATVRQGLDHCRNRSRRNNIMGIDRYLAGDWRREKGGGGVTTPSVTTANAVKGKRVHLL
jgi:hypothetical protein